MDQEPTVPPGLDPAVRRRVVTVEADTRHIEKMRHEARVRGFTFSSDEPPDMAGEDEYPAPLDYLTAAIGL